MTMPPSPSTPSPERGAIKQCIAYCFGKMWANRGSNYLPERVDTAAESELAALEAAGWFVGALERGEIEVECMGTTTRYFNLWRDGQLLATTAAGNHKTLREAIDAARVSADESKERNDA